ncbi:MAG: DNA cytosine methyltransferase [Alphaproteobacteria bacterium]|nr:DNA cytosine methyltransferase [Alphaproteobacteria bacterium]
MTPVPDHVVKRKLRRLLKGEKPDVVDLFSGCGGMSLGFRDAGYNILAGVEKEDVRARTHARNFHPGDREAAHAKGRDITASSPEEILRDITGKRRPRVDVIVGGPPCQAYARVGRAKLREIAKSAKAHLDDPRGGLYATYLTWVEETQPVAVVMENVPDILRFGGVNVGELIARSLDELGYEVRYTLLNAANYGVPQTRERWFLIGIHKSVGVVPTFPEPTHYFDVPVGYRGTRGKAALWDRLPKEERPDHACPLPRPSEELAAAVSCEDALSDLPFLGEAFKAGLKRRARNLAVMQSYRCDAKNAYQRRMRGWTGFETKNGVTAHVIRALPRDYETFAQMEEGADYPKALEIAEKIFQGRLEKRRSKGERLLEGSAGWAKLWKAIVPPYDPDKFPNKWRKLERDFPSRTLMAHLSHDSYTHIHYDSEQGRTISVREAARLQSFPDGFEFCSAMNAAFGMIGNAVPPLLAWAIAAQLRCNLVAGTFEFPVFSHTHQISPVATTPTSC